MSNGPRTSSSAIASLVFGILSWVLLPFIGAILAVILGWAHLAIFVAIVLFVFLFLGGLAFFAHFVH